MRKELIGTLGILAGAAGGAIGTKIVMDDKLKKAESMSKKHLDLFLMMNQWVAVKQEGKNLADYLERKEYRNIAIYGMSYAGETLLKELENTGIYVKYGIDNNKDNLYCDIELHSMEDELDDVDAVVVTPITFFDEIAEKLSKKINCPVISLEDVLYEV